MHSASHHTMPYATSGSVPKNHLVREGDRQKYHGLCLPLETPGARRIARCGALLRRKIYEKDEPIRHGPLGHMFPYKLTRFTAIR